MKLTQAQLEQFDREGYLFFPALFSRQEVKALTDEVPALYAQRRPENVREKTGDVVRTNFAAHMYSAPFARLARHPRMVEPVEQVFGEKLYMHQFKVNGKMAFDGDGMRLTTVEESVQDVLRYAVVNLKDAEQTLGGFPYGNANRVYTGSDDDTLLNQLIPRYQADPAALAEMQSFYNTSGVLDRPLITMHTTLDQQVPYTHEYLYILKTIDSGAFLTRHLNRRIERYGHCNFTVSEALSGLVLMLLYDSATIDMNTVNEFLVDEPSRADFMKSITQHGFSVR